MLRHLEDKRLCPHCGEKLHEQSYLMARRATENVLSWRAIAWIVVAIMAVILVAS